ncbi:MAG TPA: hypothetical protein VJM47_09120 [Nitrosospira sp.]|nr:hypothetical protein [Nitrosospira sp.]
MGQMWKRGGQMTMVRRNKEARALVKGAPEVVLERCTHIYSAEGVRPLLATPKRSG